MRIPRTSCDNCLSRGKFENRDLTREARHAVDLVRTLTQSGGRAQYTLLQCSAILRGSDTKKAQQSGHTSNRNFGKLKELRPSSVIDRLLRKLVLEKVLAEQIQMGGHGMVISYVKLGPKASDFERGSLKISMHVECKRVQEVASAKTTSAVDKIVELCYNELVECRKQIAQAKGVMTHNILTSETLHEMSEVRPHTIAQLKHITGVTQLKIDFYGAQILAVLRKFPAGKPPKTDFAQEPATTSKWINSAAPAPRSVNKSKTAQPRKPKKAAAAAAPSFDRYKYGNSSGSARQSAPAKAAPAASNSMGLMPLPVPKKPKTSSVHRRL